MNDIFVIKKCTGTYEDYIERSLGYAESEESAKRICKELNDSVPTHPFNDEDNPDEYNEFMKVIDEWDNIQYNMIDDENGEFHYIDEKYSQYYNKSPEEKQKLDEEYDNIKKEIEKRKFEFFKSKGYSKKIVEQYYEWEDIQYDTPSYEYEKVSPYTNEA